ncbi:TetR/AcrR family transcriptional regulator [Chitinophaga sancti]|uniref:TetR/AcrR family transcriptional regulator n=1 Tax=Chitinophaga sancti TaxID=1004 RepID=UPI002A7637A4|nr:TetR/AcrR family transcriptional regulator [Chitinophaga sancti]WPQ62028.1 TetR/AcrR family transcriptional regulator [Chitinophaga sancti]
MSHDPSTNIELQIKEAAKRVFVRKGLEGTKLQEIAEEAGIGRTAVHYYYRSKEKLYAIVWSEFFAEISSRLPENIRTTMPVVERMKLFAEHYIDSAIRNPEIDLFVLNEFNVNPDMIKEIFLSTMPVNLKEYFLPYIEEAVEKGEMTGDPMQIFITLLSVCLFPFAGMAMIKTIMNISNENYLQLLEQRKDYVMNFLTTAFKP